MNLIYLIQQKTAYLELKLICVETSVEEVVGYQLPKSTLLTRSA